jgi:hypothetical protein
MYTGSSLDNIKHTVFSNDSRASSITKVKIENNETVNIENKKTKYARPDTNYQYTTPNNKSYILESYMNKSIQFVWSSFKSLERGKSKKRVLFSRTNMRGLNNTVVCIQKVLRKSKINSDQYQSLLQNLGTNTLNVKSLIICRSLEKVYYPEKFIHLVSKFVRNRMDITGGNHEPLWMFYSKLSEAWAFVFEFMG